VAQDGAVHRADAAAGGERRRVRDERLDQPLDGVRLGNRVGVDRAPRPVFQILRGRDGEGARLWLVEAAASDAARIRVKMAEAVTLAALHGTERVDSALRCGKWNRSHRLCPARSLRIAATPRRDVTVY
jgi:hypothetical protein